VTCALESYSVNYKLFDPAGLPIRAVISATFKEHKDPEVQAREQNLASPDVPHAHLVLEGDTLPNVVARVYRDPDRYIAVARANRLNTVRALRPGAELRLPPVRAADAS
jgi:nucleoid-associated protein YgaU